MDFLKKESFKVGALIIAGVFLVIFYYNFKASGTSPQPAISKGEATATTSPHELASTTPEAHLPITVLPSKPALFIGTKVSFLPDSIASIDSSKNTFLINLDSKTGVIPTEFRVIPETTIKKEDVSLRFDNLSMNDVVWVRAVEEGQDKYLAQQVIVTNDWRDSEVIIKNVDTIKNKITGEVFLPPQRRGEPVVLTIIPETEIKKGTAKEGENREVVGLSSLVSGDIATVSEIGFGVHPTDDKGPFYVTDIDVVSPYYCEQYLKPPGCIEK